MYGMKALYYLGEKIRDGMQVWESASALSALGDLWS